MKYRTMVRALFLSAVLWAAFGQASALFGDELALGRTGLSFTVHPEKLQMPLHIASPTEFISKVQIISYSDTTIFRKTGYFDEGAPNLRDGYFFAIANAIPMFRLHPAHREDLGVGFQGKWMIPFATDGDWIAMAMEFVIDLGITASLHPSFALSVSRKHICSHLLDRSLFTDGDRFLGTSSSDIDPQHGPMAIRDSVVFSLHFAPEKLFFPGQDRVSTSLYADYGYSLPGGDPFSDARYTRPSYRTSRYFQYGAQATVRLTFGRFDAGSLYAACNFSHFESAGYTANAAYSFGYIFPGSIGKTKISIDVTHYDGRAVLEEYYGQRERYTSIGLKLLQ